MSRDTSPPLDTWMHCFHQCSTCLWIVMRYLCLIPEDEHICPCQQVLWLYFKLVKWFGKTKQSYLLKTPSARTTVLPPRFISRLSLIVSLYVCLCLFSPWLAFTRHQYTVFLYLFVLSNSGVRRKVCSALDLQINAVSHGQRLTRRPTAASRSLLVCSVVWWNGSVSARTCDSCLFEKWKARCYYYNKPLCVRNFPSKISLSSCKRFNEGTSS